MVKFIQLVMTPGELPEGFELPGGDPSQFGMSAEDDGTRGDPLLEQNMRGVSRFAPNLDLLRSAPVRLVFGVGERSGEVLAARAPRAMAAVTGRDVVEFPGDHTRFVPAVWNMGGDPEAFAATLREVLGA